MEKAISNLQPRKTHGSEVLLDSDSAWRFEIPAGQAGLYRLAQLDDYTSLPRRKLPWKMPISFSLKARVSAPHIPGTWGFGLWNDPFSFSLGLGGMSRRFPALPNAAWFFYASPPNFLSFRDDLPAQGFLAASYHSPNTPAPILAIGSLGLPLALIAPLGRLLRKGVSRFVRQSSFTLDLDPVEWHTYRLIGGAESLQFWVDNQMVYATQVVPRGRLGLVLWIDNQYAAWRPDGRLRYGFLANEQPAWLEIEKMKLW